MESCCLLPIDSVWLPACFMFSILYVVIYFLFLKYSPYKPIGWIVDSLTVVAPCLAFAPFDITSSTWDKTLKNGLEGAVNLFPPYPSFFLNLVQVEHGVRMKTAHPYLTSCMERVFFWQPAFSDAEEKFFQYYIFPWEKEIYLTYSLINYSCLCCCAANHVR